MMVAFNRRMPAGIAGDVTRANNSKVEPCLLTASGQPGAPVSYGIALVTDAATGKVRLPAVGDAATDISGVLVRPFPLQGNGTDGLGVSTPPLTSVPADQLVSGYISVLLAGATAAKKRGAVFVRIQNPAAGKPIGGFEAASDGGNTVSLDSKSYFTGPADGGGNTELAFNI